MLTPVNDNIIVIRDESSDESEGGIVLPENAKKQERTAKVVAVGPGKFLNNGSRSEIPVSVGDKVLLAPVGAEIEFEGQKYVIVKEKDILAVIDD